MARLVDSIRTSSRGPLLQVAKASVAAIVAWLICTVIFPQPPIFAAIAALLVVQPSVNQSVSKGFERSVGVIVGVVLAFGVGYVFGTATWVVLTSIVVALLLAWVFKLGPGSANQIPISAMLVLSIGSLTLGYATERIIETVIGAVVGLVVNLAIVPPVALRPAHLAVTRLVRELSGVLDDIATVLSEPVDRARVEAVRTRALGLRALRDAADVAIASGEDSLALNPRGGRLRRVLERDRALFTRLSALVTRELGMARTVRDHYERDLVEEPTIAAIATELRRAAHDLRLLGRTAAALDGDDEEPEPITSELPALTAPLVIAQPHPEHWIVIGALMEDIRRVREEITARWG